MSNHTKGRLGALFCFLAGVAAAQGISTLDRQLIDAAERGDVPAVKSLLARGASVNAQDEKRDSAFLIAGARGRTEVLKVLLAAGPDFRLTNRYGGTALIPACHYGHVDTVKLLLGTKIDVNHVNNLGWTALLEAVILGDGLAAHTEIVRLLAAHGADVNIADREGVTPLAHARKRNYRAIIAILEKAGAR